MRVQVPERRRCLKAAQGHHRRYAPPPPPPRSTRRLLRHDKCSKLIMTMAILSNGVAGLRESITDFAGQVPGTGPRDVMEMLLLTQYFGNPPPLTRTHSGKGHAPLYGSFCFRIRHIISSLPHELKCPLVLSQTRSVTWGPTRAPAPSSSPTRRLRPGRGP
jgi:hypothetical protein